MIPETRLKAGVFSLMALVFGVLFYSQLPVRRLLKTIGESVARRGFTQFRPTLRAVFLTGVAALMWPLASACIGWLFSGSQSDFVRAFGTAFVRLALVWLPLEFLRQVCRPSGLAECHFQWPSTLLVIIRKRVRAVLLLGLPLLFVSAIFEYERAEQLWRNSLGRIVFIGFLAVSSVFVHRLLFIKGGILEQRLLKTSLPKALHRTWASVLVALPWALAFLAAIGYYDTSQTLAIRLFQTACLFFSLRVVHGLLARWVLMRRRRLTMEQLRQRRELKAEASENETATSLPITQDAADEVDLATVSEQTVRLLRTFAIVAAVFGGWLIWDDMIPALSLLRNYSVWPGLTEITWAGVLLALVIVVVTYVATTNVPGFLELTFLNYLPVDAGARFATTTMCRYVLAGVGVSLACGAIGITWDSIQWLVAAMGIGLGFGLQGIFADFVSGIILLFERPIRVGDTITVGLTTGTVTRIKMRATTVTDWDLKEYVIPNKDLVGGQLLNWTLSNQTSRIILRVGVAYGSDTALARSILLEIAQNHPSILDDPKPVAAFDGFGDSTLNLTLRCYLPDIDCRVPTTSDLHSSIDSRFRDAGIEIAFPQRDIHIRTAEQPIKSPNGRAHDESAN